MGSARASCSTKPSPLSGTRSFSDVPCVWQAGRPAAACRQDSGARCDAHRVLSALCSVQHAVRHGLASARGPAAPECFQRPPPSTPSHSLVTLPLAGSWSRHFFGSKVDWWPMTLREARFAPQPATAVGTRRLLKQAGAARTDRADCARGAAARAFSWQRVLCPLFAGGRHWSVIQRSCAVTDGHQHHWGPTLSRG